MTNITLHMPTLYIESAEGKGEPGQSIKIRTTRAKEEEEVALRIHLLGISSAFSPLCPAYLIILDWGAFFWNSKSKCETRKNKRSWRAAEKEKKKSPLRTSLRRMREQKGARREEEPIVNFPPTGPQTDVASIDMGNDIDHNTSTSFIIISIFLSLPKKHFFNSFAPFSTSFRHFLGGRDHFGRSPDERRTTARALIGIPSPLKLYIRGKKCTKNKKLRIYRWRPASGRQAWYWAGQL